MKHRKSFVSLCNLSTTLTRTVNSTSFIGLGELFMKQRINFCCRLLAFVINRVDTVEVSGSLIVQEEEEEKTVDPNKRL